MKLKPSIINFLFILRLIICLPALPFIYFLGKKIKASIPDLPEASQNINYKGNLLKKVLLLGESSIAGVGIDNHLDGIPGAINQIFIRKTGQGISWEIIAKSGYKAIDVYDHLIPQLPKEQFDFLVLGLGGNDTFQTTPPWIWRRNMMALVNELQNLYPSTRLIICAMPPVADFPVFPILLQSFMGGQTNMLRHAIMDFPEIFPHVSYLSQKVCMKDWLGENTSTDMKDFFSDGVHPSAITYQLIGNAVGEKMMELTSKVNQQLSRTI